MCNKDQIQSKEYLSVENNYKLVFNRDEDAQNFLDQLRSHSNKAYQAKITSESVTAAIRDKYRHKIKQLESEHNNMLEMKNNINMLFYNMNMYPQMYENSL